MNKMKTLRIVMILFLASLGIQISAQNVDQENCRAEMKSYFENNISDFLQTEQSKYMEALTKTEKNKLTSIREEALVLRKQGRRGTGHAKHVKGQQASCVNPQMKEIWESLEVITKSHPIENENYSKVFNSQSAKWKKEIEAIRIEHANQSSNQNGKVRSTGFHKLDRLSDPAFMLLWDADQLMMMGREMRHRDGKGRAPNGSCMNGDRPTDRRADFHSQMIPILQKEREAFDSQLNDQERESIRQAQIDMNTIREKRSSSMDKKGNAKGERPCDDEMKALRDNMHLHMETITQIAENHKEAIAESLKTIESHKEEWKQNMKGGHEMRAKGHRRGAWHKFEEPVRFLLFDASQFEENSQAKNDTGEVDMEVFPNPGNAHTTARILGAENRKVELVLYTKDGQHLKTIFSGMNTEADLALKVNLQDLKEGVYLLKVKTGEQVRSEKLIIKR